MKLTFLGKEQRTFLEDGNYHLGQTIEERYNEIEKCILSYSTTYGEENCKKIVELIDSNIISLSTPQIANLGKEKIGNTVALPVSCNIVTCSNSIYGIYSANLEVAMLSKLGAGVGIDFDYLSQKGTKIADNFYSNSKLDWINALIDTSQKVSQNGVRRGYGTPFININDNEYYAVMDEIDRNNPNKNSVLVDNTVGIKISDSFINNLLEKDKDSQKRWLKLLSARKETGNAYISFMGNMNKNNSRVYNKLGYSTDLTNICCEFIQPYIPEYTPTCVIAALNLKYWDVIESDPDIIRMAIFYLNIVNDEYIKLSKGVKGIEKAYLSAKDKRDIGLGTLGFHELLQSKGLSFGDVASRQLNKNIYSTIRKYSDLATEELATLHGPCLLADRAGLNVRNCSLLMIAPNKSTAFVASTSPGIEPNFSNIFTKKLAKIQHIFKNKYLKDVLDGYGKNTNDVWDSISNNLGSVQHLDFLDKDEKNLFLTFNEISPKDIIDLASDRQKYIDMGQSLNLINRPNYTMKDLHDIHMYAYNKDIKTLYYFYPQAHATLEQDGKKWDSCVSCAD